MKQRSLQHIGCCRNECATSADKLLVSSMLHISIYRWLEGQQIPHIKDDHSKAQCSCETSRKYFLCSLVAPPHHNSKYCCDKQACDCCRPTRMCTQAFSQDVGVCHFSEACLCSATTTGVQSAPQCSRSRQERPASSRSIVTCTTCPCGILTDSHMHTQQGCQLNRLRR